MRPRPLLSILLLTVAAALSCASTSESPPVELPIGESTVAVTARAERGSQGNMIVISVGGEDVASARFDADASPTVALEGTFRGEQINARCSQRWKPGIETGYRCLVSSDSGGPVELLF